MPGRITVGTSSWADPGFVEDWYPEDMPARDRLAWYAERFEAVELNSSFYALPQRSTRVAPSAGRNPTVSVCRRGALRAVAHVVGTVHQRLCGGAACVGLPGA